jgi:hypothetical protein
MNSNGFRFAHQGIRSEPPSPPGRAAGRRALALGCALLGCALVAQENIPPPNQRGFPAAAAPLAGGSSASTGEDRAAADRATARKRAFDQAVAQAAVGDADTAVTSLTAICRNPVNSAGWELEMASELVQVAFQLREDGKNKDSAIVARLALRHVDQCVKQASPSEKSVAAGALELAGLVQNRFFGDTNSAEAAYRAALFMSPDLTSARLALDRLDETRAAERRDLQTSDVK